MLFSSPFDYSNASIHTLFFCSGLNTIFLSNMDALSFALNTNVVTDIIFPDTGV